MVGVPVLADPLPEPLALAARLVAAVLAGYLLWVAARGHRVRTGGSLVGWPADAFVAVGAAVVGLGSHGVGAAATGPRLAAAGGVAPPAAAWLPGRTRR